MSALDFTDGGELVVDCARCHGTGSAPAGAGIATGPYAGDPDYCSACGGNGEDYWDPAPLVRNLVAAGALHVAFWLGQHHGWHLWSKTTWMPNVGGRAEPRAVEALLGEVAP